MIGIIAFLVVTVLEASAAGQQVSVTSGNLQRIEESRNLVPQLFNRSTIKRHGLDSSSKTRLLAAQQSKAEFISCLIASVSGRNAAVSTLLLRLGGRVIFQADDVDCIRGLVPTKAAITLANDTNVLDISLGEETAEAPLLDHNEAAKTPAARYAPKDFLPPVEPRIQQTGADPDRDLLAAPSVLPTISHGEQQRPTLSGDSHLPTSDVPLNDLSAANPYLPSYLMGVPQFIQSHPTFDGRGVTIAVLGAGGDADHPMLQSARLLDGTVVSKTIDFVSVDRSDTESLVPQNLTIVKTDPDGSFKALGNTYIAPRPGVYRFGSIRLSAESSAQPPVYAILWNEASNLVWVDTTLNHDFRTEPAITDFGVYQQVLRLPGRDEGFHTSIIVKTYPVEHILKVFKPSGHETGVASIAAGNAFLGSQATGVAPGARLIYFFPFRAAFAESFLLAARDPRVDLITCSFDLGDAADGESVTSEIVDRVVARYGKRIAKASGNAGSVVTSILGTASARRVITVGTTPLERLKRPIGRVRSEPRKKSMSTRKVDLDRAV